MLCSTWNGAWRLDYFAIARNDDNETRSYSVIARRPKAAEAIVMQSLLRH